MFMSLSRRSYYLMGITVYSFKNRTLDSFIVLKVAPKSRRFGSRPLSRLNEAPSFQYDVGILVIENNSVKDYDTILQKRHD
jgi:hypothetical protein